MLDASHALIGAAMAKLVPQPELGIPLAVITHFAADLVPHWDLRTRQIKRSKFRTIFLSLADAFTGYALGWWLFRRSVPLLYLAGMMFAAQLPDWLEAPWHIFDWRFPPFSWIKRLQSRLHRKQDLPWGLVWQAAVAGAFLGFSL